ncbi:MAG: 30S ribosomal protein S6 [Candidatus Moraniibacteriota bacterium]
MALQYEVFYAVGEKDESQLPQIQEEVKGLVEAAGGTWLAEEMVERRKLAYAIKKETRAVYIAKRFTMPDADERKKTDKEGIISELSRQLELHKGVLRHIIVRAEGLPALGEREMVPQIPRPGRRDDRRGDRQPQPSETQVREQALDARLAHKPEVAVAPKEALKTVEEKAVVKEEVKEKAEVVEKKEEKKVEAPKAKKKAVEEKEVGQKAEKVEAVKEEKKSEEEAPKKRVTRKKKEATLDEEEIDKKLDEVLNL